MNLVRIAQSWALYLQASSSTRERMEKRLKICDSCPDKTQVDGAGQIVLQAMNDERNLFKCGLCNCPLGALSAHPQNACKANRW